MNKKQAFKVLAILGRKIAYGCATMKETAMFYAINDMVSEQLIK
jgi:hypothetical protein